MLCVLKQIKTGGVLHVKGLIHHEGPEGFLKGRNIEGGRRL